MNRNLDSGNLLDMAFWKGCQIGMTSARGTHVPSMFACLEAPFRYEVALIKDDDVLARAAEGLRRCCR